MRVIERRLLCLERFAAVGERVGGSGDGVGVGVREEERRCHSHDSYPIA
jgi:hypothetical protein